MGIKSRGSYKVGICLKKCSNRGVACQTCIRYSNYKEIKCQKIDKKEL